MQQPAYDRRFEIEEPMTKRRYHMFSQIVFILLLYI